LWSSPGGSLGWDVKIGTGGIREIEFFVQALQLVHCGTRSALRVRNTLDALDRLLYAGLISSEDHETLGDAYDLYRRLEHRVQMQEDRQSHRLPTTKSALDALARRMGTTRDALEATILRAREGVSQIFGRLFRESAQTPEEPTLRQASALELEVVLAARGEGLMERPVLEALREAGFERPRQVAGQLQILSEKDYGPFSPRSSTRDRELGKYLLNACANSPEPEQAFSFITRLITTVGDREWFFRMLRDNPHATQLLVHLFGSSDYLSGLLLRDPNVVSRLLGVGETVVERSAEQMREELATRLAEIADPSHRIGRIYRFHQEETLRLALHLAGGAARIEETNRQLANLAELVLCEVMQEIWLNLRRKVPMSPGSIHDLPFCVLAMGKLGGMELGFGSDLDLVFVYEPEERIGLDHTIFAKLAQRLVRTLSTLSAEGRLYEVDTRLRPSGQQGTLVVSVDALRDYHTSGGASLWERQAMIRARPLTGTASIRAQVGSLRRAIAFLAPLPEELSESFVSMRARMLEASSHAVSERAADFDIKSSRGGLIDIEFMTQYLQLCARDRVDFDALPASEDRPHQVGELLDRGLASQNTWRALEALSTAPAIGARFPEVDFGALVSDYLFLRRLEALIRLDVERGQTVLPANEAARQMLARRAGFHGEDAWDRLELALEQLRGRVQESWSQVFT
jgi:glutamate-ammonia-ligase adenylyltransferase